MSIHLLADQGDKSGVAQCIAARANVNEADTTGQKPLHYAAAKGYDIFVITYHLFIYFLNFFFVSYPQTSSDTLFMGLLYS